MDNNCIVIVDEYLQHDGTKGMKWGRRLYQYKDGSLTPLGRLRYNKQKKAAAEKRAATRAAKKKAAEAEAAAKAKRAKDVESGKISSKHMTEDELKTRIARLQLEKTYNDALRDQKSATVSRGKKFLDKFLDSSSDKLAENVAADLLSQSIKVMGVKGVNALLERKGFEADVHTNNKKK